MISFPTWEDESFDLKNDSQLLTHYNSYSLTVPGVTCLQGSCIGLGTGKWNQYVIKKSEGTA